MLIGVQTTRSKIAVETANRKVVGISAQIKGLRYFGISRALLANLRLAFCVLYRSDLTLVSRIREGEGTTTLDTLFCPAVLFISNLCRQVLRLSWHSGVYRKATKKQKRTWKTEEKKASPGLHFVHVCLRVETAFVSYDQIAITAIVTINF